MALSPLVGSLKVLKVVFKSLKWFDMDEMDVVVYFCLEFCMIVFPSLYGLSIFNSVFTIVKYGSKLF